MAILSVGFLLDGAGLNNIGHPMIVLVIAGSILLLGAILSLAHTRSKRGIRVK